MDIPSKDKWHRNWSDSEVIELTKIAEENRLRGAMNDEAAFVAAEYSYQDNTDPFLRRS